MAGNSLIFFVATQIGPHLATPKETRYISNIAYFGDDTFSPIPKAGHSATFSGCH